MNKKEKKILDIYKRNLVDFFEVEENRFVDGIFGAKGGVLMAILTSEYLLEQFEDQLDLKVNELFNSIDQTSHFSLCSGISGDLWFLQQLKKLNLIELESGEFDHWVKRLSNVACSLIQEGRYDYLYESLGVYFAICEYDAFSKADVNSLVSSFNSERVWLKRDLGSDKISLPENIDLGVAHGIMAFVKVITKLYLRFKDPRLKQIIDSFIQFYLSIYEKRKNIGQNSLLFPYSIAPNGEIINNDSRLAWCYGDLGISIILLNYANAFDDSKVRDTAIQIIDNTLSVKQSELKINDFGLCHGAGGAALAYRIWYYETKEKRFQEKAEYWHNIALEMILKHEKPLNLDFLEGISGVILEIEHKYGRIEKVSSNENEFWIELLY